MKGDILTRRFFCIKRNSDAQEIDRFVHELDYDIEQMVACGDSVYVYLVKRDNQY